MDDDELREILGRVAAGELDADEAARLLDPDAGPDDDDDGDGIDEEPDDDLHDRQTEPPTGDMARELRVAASARKVRIVGDPTVREILVRGASIRRENDVLLVDVEPDWYDDDEARSSGFVIAGGGPGWWGERSWERDWNRDWDRRRQHASHGPGPGSRPGSRPGPRGPHGSHGPFGPFGPAGRRGGRGRNYAFNAPIDIRANPELDLALDVSAGSARVVGMTGKISGSVNAGSASFTDVRGPFDFTVGAGSLTVQGPISRGDSRIGCDIGSLKLRLEPGADVRMTVESTMSKPDIRVASWGANENGEWIVGDGTATLAIVASMSSVKVREG